MPKHPRRSNTGSPRPCKQKAPTRGSAKRLHRAQSSGQLGRHRALWSMAQLSEQLQHRLLQARIGQDLAMSASFYA